MIGVDAGSCTLDPLVDEIIIEILREDTSQAKYYRQWAKEVCDTSAECSCDTAQRHNYGFRCIACQTRFDANRLALQYRQAKKMACEICKGAGVIDGGPCECSFICCSICDDGRVKELSEDGLLFYLCETCGSEYSDHRQAKLNKRFK